MKIGLVVSSIREQDASGETTHSLRTGPSISESTTKKRIDFGCDYNPEQWPREVWNEDVRLMQEAGITIVAINVFGWALIQPRIDQFDFSALDAVIDLLHRSGIGVNLGTGTSSPPPWLTQRYPEILPTAIDGTRRWPGGRQAWCPSSPVFREHALTLVRKMALRYANHPAVRLWHVSNELGCHNALCYCDVSGRAFQDWLQRRYGSLEALNDAWGTRVWSQSYAEWSEILPPRLTLSTANPTHALDYARFSSDEVLGYYLAEAAVLRELSSIPVTTNFMVTAHISAQNYWEWAPHVDIVANDHYLDHRLPDPHQELSFSADLTRGLASGGSWMLMESSIGAVNWQPRNLAKAPSEVIRNSLTHLARGADGICFFQWRASAQGSEKFHSALVSHSGNGTAIWREVLELSRILATLDCVVGSRVVADTAIVFSWESWWAVDQDSHPTEDVRYLDQVHRIYRALWNAGLTVDIVPPGADLTAYRLVVVPCLYLITDAAARGINDYVASGGHAVVTFFSGIVDRDDRVRLGGYPGAFRDMLGIATEEFRPLADGASLSLDDGSAATVWSEMTHLRGAESIASYTDGSVSGSPAITRNEHGAGVAWYLGTQLEPDALEALLGRVGAEAGVTTSGAPAGVEIVRRRSVDHDYMFIINHTASAVDHSATGLELTTGVKVHNAIRVPAGAVRVVQTSPTPTPKP